MVTSSASLDTKPGSNWVQETAKQTPGGGLPPKVRQIARALMRENPTWTKSHAIAVAVSQSKKNAAKGSAKAAVTVGQWDLLKARNAALQVSASQPALLGAILELSNSTTVPAGLGAQAGMVELANPSTGQVLDLLDLASPARVARWIDLAQRRVRTAAGVARYGKPIGSPLGKGTPGGKIRTGGDHVRAALKARETRSAKAGAAATKLQALGPRERAGVLGKANPSQLAALDGALTDRAAKLGRPGEVSATHKAVKDARAKAGSPVPGKSATPATAAAILERKDGKVTITTAAAKFAGPGPDMSGVDKLTDSQLDARFAAAKVKLREELVNDPRRARQDYTDAKRNHDVLAAELRGRSPDPGPKHQQPQQQAAQAAQADTSARQARVARALDNDGDDGGPTGPTPPRRSMEQAQAARDEQTLRIGPADSGYAAAVKRMNERKRVAAASTPAASGDTAFGSGAATPEIGALANRAAQQTPTELRRTTLQGSDAATLRALDTELARRATLLGRPGKVSRGHKAVQDELALRGGSGKSSSTPARAQDPRTVRGTAENVVARQAAVGKANRRAEPGLPFDTDDRQKMTAAQMGAKGGGPSLFDGPGPDKTRPDSRSVAERRADRARVTAEDRRDREAARKQDRIREAGRAGDPRSVAERRADAARERARRKPRRL